MTIYKKRSAPSHRAKVGSNNKSATVVLSARLVTANSVVVGLLAVVVGAGAEPGPGLDFETELDGAAGDTVLLPVIDGGAVALVVALRGWLVGEVTGTTTWVFGEGEADASFEERLCGWEAGTAGLLEAG